MEGDLRRGLFPAEAEPEQVMEIVKVLANIGGGLDVLELEKILKIDADQSARLVNACQMLDLTRIHDGRVVLTENGTRLNDLSKTEKGNFLAGRLASIEPFRTAIEIAGKQKTVSVETVVDALSRLKLRWTEEGDDELNELLVHNILVDWVVFAGLLQYDGRADKFRAKIVD